MSADLESQRPSDEELARTISAAVNLPRPSGSVRAAFEALHERYASLILAFLAARVRDAALAQDLSQEVWCRVWKTLPTSFQGGNFRAWLYEIARNRLIDETRKRKTQSLPDNYDPAATPSDADSIDVERRDAFRDCFAHLDIDRQKVVQLRLSGRSHDEIGAELGINSNTVMTRFHRAKKDLADCLQGKL